MLQLVTLLGQAWGWHWIWY